MSAPLVDDPRGALADADVWEMKGGGDRALDCQALAEIATGAALLQQVAHTSAVAGLARVSILAHAAQARLTTNQPDCAFDDASETLAISPADADLLIDRAGAAGALDRLDAAIGALNKALGLESKRADALVLCAGLGGVRTGWIRRNVTSIGR